MALFRPADAVRGSVILSPGRSEPIEKYAEVIGELLSRGFNVLVHDWRGQGLSTRQGRDPLLGLSANASLHLRDFDRLLSAFADRLPRPWIALGHSMGAGLNLMALARGERRFVAAILSAPMVLIRTLDHSPERVRHVALLMRLVGRGASSPLPPRALEHETFDGNILTHDRARWERSHALLSRRPELRLGVATWSWLAFALGLSAKLRARGIVERIPTPIVAVAAGDDRLCVNAVVAELMRRSPQGRYLEIEGAFHEILMETDARRQVFWREFDTLAAAAAPAVAKPS